MADDLEQAVDAGLADGQIAEFVDFREAPRNAESLLAGGRGETASINEAMAARQPKDSLHYAQEDLVVERSRGRLWSWSASRPDGVCDRESGFARSMPMMIGVCAAISNELGKPLCLPGTAASFQALNHSVDATLLTTVIAWITTMPACAN